MRYYYSEDLHKFSFEDYRKKINHEELTRRYSLGLIIVEIFQNKKYEDLSKNEISLRSSRELFVIYFLSIIFKRFLKENL